MKYLFLIPVVTCDLFLLWWWWRHPSLSQMEVILQWWVLWVICTVLALFLWRVYAKSN